MEDGFKESLEADKKQEKIPYPKIDFTYKELDLIKDAVSGNTWVRFEYLLDKRVKELDAPVTNKEKELVERKYIDPDKFV